MTNRQALVLALFVLAVPNADAFVLSHARVHGRVARAHRPQTQRLWSVQRLNLTPDDSQANEIQISVEIAERAEGVRRAGGNTMERVDVAASASPIWEQVQWWKLLNENYAGWLLLNLVTVLWGSQHAIIKLALDDSSSDTSPAQLNLARFFIAAGIFLAASLPPSRRYAEHGHASTAASDSADSATAREREIDSAHYEASGNAATAASKEMTVPGVGAETNVGGVASGESLAVGESLRGKGQMRLWMSGVELGVYMFAGYAMQAIGLQYTSASRSAFLLYLNVKLVPLLGCVLYGRSVARKTWLNVAVAVAGTVLLGYDGNAPPNVGDAWSVAAAAASALFILRLEGAVRIHQPLQLNACAMVTVSLLCLLWTAVVDPPQTWTFETLVPHGVALEAALYLGIVATALTSYLQAIGQRTIKAESAAIIYAMDPVYAAGFSYVLLGERLGVQGFAGGALLVAAALLNLKIQSEEEVPAAAE